MNFNGQRILVTGGTGGIGAATVKRFRDAGARVAVGSRSEERFRSLSDTVGADNLFPAIGALDSLDACSRVIDQAVDALEGLDVLVNAAGVFEEVPTGSVTQEHWDRNMAVNVGGPFFCTQAALPMLRDSHGNVVNIASDAGIQGFSASPVYSAAKAAVVNLTRAHAIELAHAIRVNCVCPGNVDTDMIRRAAEASGDAADYLSRAHARAPSGRMAHPDEVAGAILYLASTEAAFTNGAILAVDGGGVCGD